MKRAPICSSRSVCHDICMFIGIQRCSGHHCGRRDLTPSKLGGQSTRRRDLLHTARRVLQGSSPTRPRLKMAFGMFKELSRLDITAKHSKLRCVKATGVCQ